MPIQRLKGDVEVQLFRLLKRLEEQIRGRGIAVARWARASCVDRTYLYRILRGEQTPSLITVDALVDGAYICFGDPVVLKLDLQIGGEPIRLVK